MFENKYNQLKYIEKQKARGHGALEIIYQGDLQVSTVAANFNSRHPWNGRLQ